LKDMPVTSLAVVAVVLGVAGPPDSSAPPPSATPACEEVVSSILDEWQVIIDEWADVPLEDLAAGERIYNVTDVPIGDAGCEPLTATTIAADRAGMLEAETATAAVVRGLILSDVGEMAVFGPGLDLDVPVSSAPPDVVADLDALAALEPAADAPCDDWEALAVAALRESVDVAAQSTLLEMFTGDDAYLDSQAAADAALATAFDGANRARCDRREFLLGVLAGWPELQATNLTANLAIGGHTDFVYGELFEDRPPPTS
jgi:hypothetical protein